MADLETRQQPELDCLLRKRIGAGDDRLARDHRRRSRQHDHRQQCPIGIEQKEWILDGFLVGQHERALSQIVDGERRQGDA